MTERPCNVFVSLRAQQFPLHHGREHLRQAGKRQVSRFHSREAARPAWSIWPGHPAAAHWGINDPVTAEGTDIEKEAAFVAAFKYLKNRFDSFIALPLESIDHLSLHSRLEDIGKMEGASPKARSKPPG